MDPPTTNSPVPPTREQDGLRDPSTLFFQKDTTRRSIIASYWLVFLLASPLWWYTTSIQRLSLPTSRVQTQSRNQLHLPVSVRVDTSNTKITDSEAFIIELQQLLRERATRAPEQWQGIELRISDAKATAPTNGAYDVILGEEATVVNGRQMMYQYDGGTVSDLADKLSNLLVPFSAVPEQQYRVAHYSPRYRLAFTLLNEDAADGPSVIGWDIQNAFRRHISPIVNGLSVLHNFTVESQVQFHGPLAFTPTHLDNGAYGLTPEDLTVFINSAEWTLSSSASNDPVLHFLMFVPTASRRPLHILDSNGTPSSSKAFLLPQWGGIVIFNPSHSTSSHLQMSASDLDPIFQAFSNQLLSLLGVPHLSTGVGRAPSASGDADVLSRWQLDALLRLRALENAKDASETLQSIVKLVDQIENMPVGQDVKGDVQDALTALDRMYASSSVTEAVQHSARAITLASRAFFNPGMLALLYFPAEHKYAVYTPLFASAVIPLFVAAMREILAWNRQRRQAMATPTPR